MGGQVFLFGVNKHTFLFNCDSIAIGCLGAFVYKMPEFPKMLNSKKTLALSVLLVIVPEVLKRNYLCGPLTVPFGNSFQSIGFMILILLSIVYFKVIPFSFLNLKPVVLIGRLSFSLYIWQQLFFGSEVFGFGNLGFLKFPFNIFLVFIIAYCSYRVIEEPLDRVKNSLLK